MISWTPFLATLLVCLGSLTPSSMAQDSRKASWASKTVKIDAIEFSIPESCSIEKVSDDALCTWPIVAAFAPDGSLVVAESVWNLQTKQTVQEQLISRPHRLVRLRDSNNDGKFDSRQVIADQLSFPEGILCIGNDILLTAPPQIWKLSDLDGDGVCENRQVWFDGTTLTGCANDLHGPWLGPDGWIYWTKSAFAEQTHEILTGTVQVEKTWTSKASHLYRRHPQGGPIDPVMTGGMDNLVDVAWLPNGDRFFCATFLHHPRNGFRDGIGAATYGSIFGKPHAVLDGHPRTGKLMDPTAELGPAAPAGLMFLGGLSPNLNLPPSGIKTDELGFLLCAQFNLHQISLHRLTKRSDQAHYRAESFPLVSSDRIDFHPVDLLLDTDGSILIVDTGGWYDLCCPSSGTDQRVASGGIYRLRGLTSGQSLSKNENLLSEQKRLEKLTSRSIDYVRSDDSQRPALEEQYHRLVLDSMRDQSPSVVTLACHLASLDRLQASRDRASELLVSPNASLRRSGAEILGRIGIQGELQEILNQIRLAKSDRTLSHSLIYALIEGASDEDLLESLLGSAQADPAGPSTIALVRVLEHRKRLSLEHANLVLQIALAQDQDTSEFGLQILEAHPQWIDAILLAIDKSSGTPSDLPSDLPSDATLSLVARWSDNPQVAQWACDHLLKAPSSATAILSKLGTRPVPQSWIQPLAKQLKESSPDELSLWQSALLGRTWKGDLSAIQQALADLLPRVQSNPNSDTKQLRWLNWIALMPPGSELPEVLELEVLQVALADPTALADPSIGDSELRERRNVAWKILSNLRLRSDRSRDRILDHLANAGPLELPVAIESYLQESTVAQDAALLEALHGLATAKTLSPESILRRLKNRSPEIQNTWKEALETWTRPDPEIRSKVEQWMSQLKPGNPSQGYHVFRSTKATCSACHQVGYVGGNLGPVLSKIGQSRSRRDLLEAILFPSARLEQAYRSTKVLLSDGEIVQGLLVSESPKELVLQVTADQRRSIPTADIDRREASNVSIMPAGLENQMTIEELSDLIAFLENAK
ncbi:MAG: c-type cytochrome [Planctomycetota bacterium]|nr:c-type cytochrome [Planctomycetota bacterium]